MVHACPVANAYLCICHLCLAGLAAPQTGTARGWAQREKRSETEAIMSQTAHTEHFASFAEFYPFYLEEHRNMVSRRLHFVGSLGVIGCLAMALATGDWLWLPAALVSGYGCAWVGHYFFEKNRPATFRHPVYSLMGDWVMFKDICTGKISL
jgi:hypothetical protein